MITESKIKIYIAYKGDIDAWGRVNKKNERELMTDSDWYQLKGLVQDLVIISRGLASESYIIQIESRLQDECDNMATINLLKKAAQDIS